MKKCLVGVKYYVTESRDDNFTDFCAVAAPTISQCFKKFFAMRPDNYVDLAGFVVVHKG